ncbi:MAG: oligosaccharide flippase family protein [Oscillospiraceae bacterium]|nr:oligosaccharide flippase family protein [Oscillospiraceae bacterium]
MKHNTLRELFGNTFVLGVSKLASPLLSFLLVPLYTAIVAPEQFGTVDIIQTYAALLVPIVLLRLDIGLFRFTVDARKDENEIKRVFTNTLIIIVPILILSLTIVGILGINNIIPFIGIVLLYTAVQLLENIFDPLARGLGRNKLFTVSALVSAAANIFFGYLFVALLHLGAAGILLASTSSSIVRITILVLCVKAYKLIDLRTSSKEVRKELLKFSTPLILDGVSFWVINMSDRTIISVIMSLAANGIYSIANKFSGIVGTATTIFWMAWSEMTAKYVETEDYGKMLSNTLDIYLRLLFGGVGLFLTIVPAVWNSLIGSEYQNAFQYVPILVVSSMINAMSTFYAPIYTALKLSKRISISTVLGAVTNVLLSLFLIPIIGLYGAAIATAFGYLLIFIYRYIDISKKEGVHIDWGFLFVAIGVLSMNIWLFYTRVVWVNVVIAIIMFIIYNKELWKEILVPHQE